jgi:hypothetical protein
MDTFLSVDLLEPSKMYGLSIHVTQYDKGTASITVLKVEVQA